MPSLGISDMNHQFSLPNVYLKFDLLDYTQTGLIVTVRVTYEGTFEMKLSYLAPDPSMNY